MSLWQLAAFPDTYRSAEGRPRYRGWIPGPLSRLALAAQIYACLLSWAMLLPGPATAASPGDPDAGAKAYQQRCSGCHALDADRIGPRHRGVVGRKAGTVPGYAYSPALQDANVVWDEVNLDKWLTNPQSLIPGQRMDVLTRDAKIRADIIAFLSNQHLAASAP